MLAPLSKASATATQVSALMYSAKQSGMDDIKCRAKHGVTSFPCSSCAPLAQFREEQCSTYEAPHVAMGLTARAASSVQGGVFDTQFYTRLDQQYQRYGKYCKRVASIGAARRHMRNAGAAMKQDNAAAAIDEMEKAAIAMDVNGTESAKRAADAVDNAARNMAESVDALIAAKNSGNGKVQEKVLNAVESLENGALLDAGSKMLAVAAEIGKNEAANGDTDAVAVAAQTAESLKKAANNIKQAAAEMANEQRDAAKERIEVAKEERKQVNAGLAIDADKKREIEVEAAVVIAGAIEEAVRNGNNAALGANSDTPPLAAQAPVSSAVRDSAAAVNATGASVANRLSMHGQRLHRCSNAIYAAARGVEKAQKVPGRCGTALATEATQRAGGGQCALKHRQSVSSIYGGTLAPQERAQAHSGVAAPRKWRYEQPAAQFAAVVQRFGEPDWLVDQPGGQAVWLDRGIFSRIVLQDEMIPHSATQFDYLTLAVSGVAIPLEGQDELNRLAKNVWYDATTATLYARCNSTAACVASLIVAIDLAHDDDMTLEEALDALPELLQQAQEPERYAQMLAMLEADVRAARAEQPNALA